MASRTLTKDVRTKIAACAAHGFYYWSDSGTAASTLWATDDNQRWHTVRLHRTSGKSEHSCTRYDGFTDTCIGDRGAVKSYTVPTEIAEVAQLLGLTDIEQAQPEPVVARAAEPVVPTVTAPRPHRRREVVIAAIEHDPTWLAGFTAEELSDVLGHTRHDDEVRAELDRRKEAS